MSYSIQWAGGNASASLGQWISYNQLTDTLVGTPPFNASLAHTVSLYQVAASDSVGTTTAPLSAFTLFVTVLPHPPTPTATATATRSATPTATKSATATATRTATGTATASATATATASATATATATASATATPTTVTPTATITATATATATTTPTPTVPNSTNPPPSLAPPTGTSSASPNTPTPTGNEGSAAAAGTGTIVSGILGAIIAVILIAFAIVLLVLWRRRRSKEAGNTATDGDIEMPPTGGNIPSQPPGRAPGRAPAAGNMSAMSQNDVVIWLASLGVSDETVQLLRQGDSVDGQLLDEAATANGLQRLGVVAPQDRMIILNAVRDMRAQSAQQSHVLIRRTDLNLGNVIAAGNFGRVFRAWYNGALVAIKMPANMQDEVRDDFMEEARLMKMIPPFPHVVQYFGVCLEPTEVMLVLEFCHHGSLEDHLRQRPNIPIDHLIRFARDIAAGMSHLSAFIVHRDLATRNILLAVGPPPLNMVAKVADFGLSRPLKASGYYRLTGRHGVPVAWCPNEIAENFHLPHEQQHPHTPASDVWMFGALLWEMFSGIPNGVDSEGKPLKRVPNPRRDRMPPLLQPERCPASIYAVMVQCWAINPTQRPAFHQVHTLLTDITSNSAYVQIQLQ